MRSKPCLTLEDVRKLATACEAEAARNKWIVTVAIVDDAGYLLHLQRMDGAGPITVEAATQKARTAALSRRPSRFWEERVKERPVFLKFPDNFPVIGGVPLVYQGECVGAIGVSGVQSHEDEQIAQAGASALT